MVTSGTTNIGEKKHNDARNEAAAGIGKGRISGVQGAHEPTEEEKKKLREQKAQNEMAYQSMDDAQALHELYHELEELEAQRAALETQITDSQTGLNQLVEDLLAEGRTEDAQIVQDVIEMKEYVVVDYNGKEHIVFKDEENPDARYVIDRESGDRVYVINFDEPDKSNAWKYINGQKGQKFGNFDPATGEKLDPEHARELEESNDKLKDADHVQLRKDFNGEDNHQYAAHQDLDKTKEDITTTNEAISEIKNNPSTDPSLIVTNDKDRISASSNITLISDPDNQQTSLTEANTFAMAASPDQPQPEETQEPEPVILTSENDSTLTATQSNTV